MSGWCEAYSIRCCSDYGTNIWVVCLSVLSVRLHNPFFVRTPFYFGMSFSGLLAKFGFILGFNELRPAGRFNFLFLRVQVQ